MLGVCFFITLLFLYKIGIARAPTFFVFVWFFCMVIIYVLINYLQKKYGIVFNKKRMSKLIVIEYHPEMNLQELYNYLEKTNMFVTLALSDRIYFESENRSILRDFIIAGHKIAYKWNFPFESIDKNTTQFSLFFTSLNDIYKTLEGEKRLPEKICVIDLFSAFRNREKLKNLDMVYVGTLPLQILPEKHSLYGAEILLESLISQVIYIKPSKSLQTLEFIKQKLEIAQIPTENLF